MLLITFAVPLYLTYAYRLIPVPVRKTWGMRGGGSSHIVVGMAMLGEANLWPVFLRCIAGVRFLPGYIAGSVIRIITHKG